MDRHPVLQTETRRQKLRRMDWIACGIFVGFAVYFCALCLTQPPPLTYDEPFYLTMSHRLLLGDRLLLEEWHVAQFSAVFQFPLVWGYLHLTGSTQGVLLFARFYYAVLHLLFSTWLYTKLRRYGGYGLIAAALFCGYQPIDMMAVSYYNVCLAASATVAVLLFLEDPPRPRQIFAAGFAVACGVLAQPLTALIYAGYSVAVLILRLVKGKNRTSPLFAPATWRWLTGGVLLCAALYAVFFGMVSDYKALLALLRDFFTDGTFRTAIIDPANGHLPFAKYVKRILQTTGWIPLILTALLAAVTLFDKKRMARRQIYISAATALLSFVTVWGVVNSMRIYKFLNGTGYMLPLFLFGGYCCLLTKEKDPRLIKFWVYTVLVSALQDFSSRETAWIACSFGEICAVLMVRDLLRELSQDAPHKRRDRHRRQAILRAAVLMLAAGHLLSGCLAVWHVHLGNAQEKLPMETMTFGPYRGIRMPVLPDGSTEASYRDLDRIRALNTQNRPIYIADMMPWAYLYLEMPYGCSSTWHDVALLERREAQYWARLPDKRPAYIYVPTQRVYEDELSDETLFALLDSLCEYRVIEGEQGRILQVTAWHFS